MFPKSCQQPTTSRCLIVEDSSNKKPCNSQESVYSLTSEGGEEVVTTVETISVPSHCSSISVLSDAPPQIQQVELG